MSLNRRGFFGLVAAAFLPAGPSLPRVTAGIDVQQEFACVARSDGNFTRHWLVSLPQGWKLEQLHRSGYRSTLKKLTVTMPTDAVLISSRRLQQLPDSEILKLVKSNSVAIIR